MKPSLPLCLNFFVLYLSAIVQVRKYYRKSTKATVAPTATAAIAAATAAATVPADVAALPLPHRHETQGLPARQLSLHQLLTMTFSLLKSGRLCPICDISTYTVKYVRPPNNEPTTAEVISGSLSVIRSPMGTIPSCGQIELS
jgi:hypothetical protein